MEQGKLSGAGLDDRESGLLSSLNSWATLHPILNTLNTEEDVKFLMRSELGNKNRIRILDRLYSRYNVLRRERERRELSDGKLPF